MEADSMDVDSMHWCCMVYTARDELFDRKLGDYTYNIWAKQRGNDGTVMYALFIFETFKSTKYVEAMIPEGLWYSINQLSVIGKIQLIKEHAGGEFTEHGVYKPVGNR